MTFDGSQETGLVVHPANDGGPFWTPDGKHIVFTSDRSGSNALWILEVDEGKPKGDPTQVKEMGKEFGSMGFTVDGSFYYNTAIADLDVYVAPLDFKAGKVLAAPTKISLLFEGFNLAPVWSPDGKYLAYASQRSDERVLVIRNVATGQEREVLPKTNVQLMQNKFHLAPQWSPDSDSILVTGADNNLKIARGLYLIDAETGNVSPVVRNESKKEDDKYTEPFWQVYSKDGKHIYYIGNSKLIMRHNLETHAESELYRSTPRIYRLAISPDGRQLAFVEGASELQGCKVCTISTSGSQVRELYTLKKTERGTWMVGLWWTPDGTNLVLGKTDNLPDKKTEIWMIPVKGGEPSKFELPVKANHLSLHPDGRRIAFTGGELGGDSEIWVLENFLPKTSTDK
jgi:Tol biopolymer transport system component